MSLPDQQTEISAPMTKAVSMWAMIAAGIGVNTWAEAASFASFCAAAMGALYSTLLVCEWIWKKLRPAIEPTRGKCIHED